MALEEQELIYAAAEELLSTSISLIMILVGYEHGITLQVQASTKKIITWRKMTDWPSTTNLLLSDGIVVWRAWCLFQQDRLQRLVLVMLMIANIGINVADCIWSDFEFLLSKTSILDWISVGFSMMLNMVVTILFACKAWNHRRYIADLHASMSGKGTWAKNILNLLIESGTIFCAVQFIYIIVILLDAYSIIASLWPLEIVSGLFAIACAGYPVAVIVLAPMLQTTDTICYIDSIDDRIEVARRAGGNKKVRERYCRETDRSVGMETISMGLKNLPDSSIKSNTRSVYQAKL
ncbi:hypothetical protein BDP27DRAFT_1367481 [Rhodocollybia butyracea]|uniref:Uncharacterized protein n=1 Tax=Rhodocollybia butyracea TaxID=206335 RepID=A0A9P5U2N2_9AGAR|nr:hypothetical protein BDP27DRAFT_1367481 [Rhodocollybia butyracea]